VAAAALVGLGGRPDDPVTAVVAPRDGGPPTLGQLREHLLSHGQDTRFLPARLEVVQALPKTLTGKVRKAELRRLLGGR
jgi:cyclohexanecarboxylate-CoA ligase